MLQEKFETINGFEDYEVSNYGYVVSHKQNKDRILKMGKNGGISLADSFTKKGKVFSVQRLVWDYFGDKKRNGYFLCIRFKDGNHSNCRIDNLYLETRRDIEKNIWVDSGKKTSKYSNVYFNKNVNKWRSYIKINGKEKHLGYFETEKEAFEAVKKFEKEQNFGA